jgi:hypothetical protein
LGLRAMLALGFEMLRCTGAGLTVVVVTGLTVVVVAGGRVVVVVAGGRVVGMVGTGAALVTGAATGVSLVGGVVVEVRATWAILAATVVGTVERTAFAIAIVVVVGANVVVVTAEVVVARVEPVARTAVPEDTFATAGSAVKLRTSPATNEPIEPATTDRRGRRRRVVDGLVGPRLEFCPCVKMFMNQLSETNRKVLPRVSQHLLNSKRRTSCIRRTSCDVDQLLDSRS